MCATEGNDAREGSRDRGLTSVWPETVSLRRGHSSRDLSGGVSDKPSRRSVRTKGRVRR